jgi:hypothetical protein
MRIPGPKDNIGCAGSITKIIFKNFSFIEAARRLRFRASGATAYDAFSSRFMPPQ